MPNPRLVTVEISPGEWYDRWTILEIKVQRLSGEKQRDALAAKTAWENGCEDYVQASFADSAISRFVHFLRVTNGKLWDVEDKIRDLDGQIFPLGQSATVQLGEKFDLPPYVTAYLETARAVYVTNDQRNKFKAEIDAHFGMIPEVKEYSQY